jgi:hypothetical protein
MAIPAIRNCCLPCIKKREGNADVRLYGITWGAGLIQFSESDVKTTTMGKSSSFIILELKSEKKRRGSGRGSGRGEGRKEIDPLPLPLPLPLLLG